MEEKHSEKHFSLFPVPTGAALTLPQLLTGSSGGSCSWVEIQMICALAGLSF